MCVAVLEWSLVSPRSQGTSNGFRVGPEGLNGPWGLLPETPKSWNLDLRRFMLAFLLSFVLGSEDDPIPTYWLLLQGVS